MKIKLRIVITGLTCVFLLVSGILYSCAYQGHKTSAVLITTSTEQSTEESTEQTSEQTSEEDTEDATTQTDAALQNSGGTRDSLGIKDNSGTSDNSTSFTDGVIQSGGTSDQVEEGIQNFLLVHICGAVVNPGVYRVETGARLVELIELAGGLTKTAAGDYINQASEILDGQRIYIPDQEELKELTLQEYQAGDTGTMDTSPDQAESSLVNINTADATELMDLPGIGQAKADSIISYRNTNGSFKTTEELMNIPGIKQGLFSQISSLITVD